MQSQYPGVGPILCWPDNGKITRRRLHRRRYVRRCCALHLAEDSVVGWSFGGVVAFHLACELRKEGVKVNGVVLIDSPSPFTTEALPPALVETMVGSSRLQAQMNSSSAALVAYEPRRDLPSADSYPRAVILRCLDAFHASSIPGCSRIPFLEDRGDRRTIVQDWENLTGQRIPILDVPGHHFSEIINSSADL